MVSIRTTEDLLLDAARDTVMAIGVRRTTAAEVARRAGVSRMTLYRTFPDASALLSALMAREFGSLVELAYTRTAALPTARERLIAGIVAGAQDIVANPLFERVIAVDPELLLTYVTDRFGETQRQAMAFFAAMLEQGQRDGSIRALDPELATHCIQIAAQGFVLSARLCEEPLRTRSFEQLGQMVDRYLSPT